LGFLEQDQERAKKVGGAVLKGVKWVNQHIIKPILPAVTSGPDKVKPGLGTAVGMASNFLGGGGNDGGGPNAVQLARTRLGNIRPAVIGLTVPDVE
jgi:hypothetical protein